MRYINPEMKITSFDLEDVITTSGGGTDTPVTTGAAKTILANTLKTNMSLNDGAEAQVVTYMWD